MLSTVLRIAEEPPGYPFTQTDSDLGHVVLHKRTAAPTSHFASIQSLTSRSDLSKLKLLEK